MKAKFSVGDKVAFKEGHLEPEWRGDWCKSALTPRESEFDSECLPEMDIFGKTYDSEKCERAQLTVAEVLVRDEPSLNGTRREVYYKLDALGDNLYREDLLEGIGETHAQELDFEYKFHSWGPDSLRVLIYRSNVSKGANTLPEKAFKLFSDHDLMMDAPNGMVISRQLMCIVKGVWFTEKYAVHEMHRFYPDSGIPNFYVVVDENGNRKVAYTGKEIMCVSDKPVEELTTNNFEGALFAPFKEFFENMAIEAVEEFDSDPDWI